jgi:RimJ/RimL family protein N-acetyltransferase
MIVRLNDGSAVLVRPIRAVDKERLAAGLDHLSEQSRLRRFLGPKPRFTAGELRYLTEVDRHNHYALVAFAPGTDYIVAAARWVRSRTDPQEAEVAVVVGDHLQGKGLGSRMARMLADAARDHGIRRIRATMSSENVPALKLMRVISSRLSDGGHDHGIHEVVADLGMAA